MRILIFHGYLLGGTGSNVYNARLAAALVDLGHEVHMLCQDRQAEQQAFVDAVGDWEDGVLRVRELRQPVRCTAYRPDIGGLLPVYVMDRYEGIQAKPFAECSEEEVDRYITANVAAVRAVAELVQPDVALANHLVMGPVILARALAGQVPYAVKVHGSALEYTVKPNPARFMEPAREGLASANAVLVGSHHTAASLWEALGDPSLPARTRLGPPGVDIARFRPRGEAEAAEGVRALVGQLRATTPPPADREDAFSRDDAAAATALERLDPERDRMTCKEGPDRSRETRACGANPRFGQPASGRLRHPLVAFVGKLIANKGVDLLLAAWPLVCAREPAARLVVVGFGSERERLVAVAAALGERVIFTGRLDHEELTELLPACDALVVPSIFPEAFGMVAAEGAACGAFPVSAAHSGLAEVSSTLARYIPPEAAKWLSFPIDDGAVNALAACLIGWLGADAELRAKTREGLVGAVREHWSWEGVARGVIAAASGELDDLAVP